MKEDLVCPQLSVDNQGNLLIAGQYATDLAAQYGTPLYVMDEDLIRKQCRAYKAAAQASFDGNYKIFYASKAASFKQMYRIMDQEQMYADVVSSGELATAIAAGFPTDRIYFHSNNKTDTDIAFGIRNRIGCFVADNTEELYAIERIAAEEGICQNVMLRITPGIDPHTFEAVSTGKVDSKFGFAIETGQATDAIEKALSLPHVNLIGLHSHVGSQVFDADVYIRTSEIMLEFLAEIQNHFGYFPQELGMGGGFGARYLPSDPVLDIPTTMAQLGLYMKEKAAELDIPLPTVTFEPGRSIVAEAGVTLYTVGTKKEIPGYKNYISVDGGMTDNIRHALYGAKYTLLPATGMDRPRDMVCDVVGKCCESGDIIDEAVQLPSSLQRGDILACLTTGAYHFSMASNYNRIPTPPVVMLSDGHSYVAVKRQTLEDLYELDI